MNTCSSMMIQAQKLKDLRCCLECAIARMLEIRCYLVSPASSPPQHASQNAGAYPLSHPHHAYTHVRKCKAFDYLSTGSQVSPSFLQGQGAQHCVWVCPRRC